MAADSSSDGRGAAPPIEGLLETALYVADLERARGFYTSVLGLRPIFESPRLVALDAGRQGVLLLFRAGATEGDQPTPGGVVPGHSGTGRLHMAFAIAADQLEPWRARLTGAGVALRSSVRWSRGGTSLYFDDPDGHVIELATPGLWSTY